MGLDIFLFLRESEVLRKREPFIGNIAFKFQPIDLLICSLLSLHVPHNAWWWAFVKMCLSAILHLYSNVPYCQNLWKRDLLPNTMPKKPENVPICLIICLVRGKVSYCLIISLNPWKSALLLNQCLNTRKSALLPDLMPKSLEKCPST